MKAALSALLLAAGCEAMPDLRFGDTASDAGPGAEAMVPTDDAGGGVDPSNSLGPDAAIADARDSSAFDAADAVACLRANPPATAGCCSAIAPCAGLACAHCAECVAQGCSSDQYCCAQVTGAGKYQGVQCADDVKNCP